VGDPNSLQKSVALILISFSVPHCINLKFKDSVRPLKHEQQSVRRLIKDIFRVSALPVTAPTVPQNRASLISNSIVAPDVNVSAEIMYSLLVKHSFII
jgi:hypothetical protein